jgi:hypothetical protein
MINKYQNKINNQFVLPIIEFMNQEKANDIIVTFIIGNFIGYLPLKQK